MHKVHYLYSDQKEGLGLRVDNILMVQEFPNMFLDDLLELVPKREKKFNIKLELYITPIFKVSYKTLRIEKIIVKALDNGFQTELLTLGSSSFVSEEERRGF